MSRMDEAKADFQAAKKRSQAVNRKYGRMSIGASVLAFTFRMIEVFADIMLGFVFIIGVGANFIPMLAVSLAGDAGVSDAIAAMSGKGADSVTSIIATILATWGFPMLFITVFLGVVSYVLLMKCCKKIHSFFSDRVDSLKRKYSESVDDGLEDIDAD